VLFRSCEWKEAYDLTVEVVEKLKRVVEADNARFVLFVLTSPLQVEHDPADRLKEEFGIVAPGNLDVAYPTKFSDDFAIANGVSFVQTLSLFREYRDDHGLAYPYFSYRTDGHWNPLGHYLAANVLARHLVSNGLVPVRDAESTLRKIEANLLRSPREILGEQAYDQIYSKTGVYRGIGSAQLEQ